MKLLKRTSSLSPFQMRCNASQVHQPAKVKSFFHFLMSQGLQPEVLVKLDILNMI